jgi:hypothetical protein
MRTLLAGLASALIAAPALADAGAPVADLPFEFSAGKIFLHVRVNGEGPYPFALDTGSPPTVIDMTLARDLGIGVHPLGGVGGAGEGTTPMGGADEVALSFGGISLPARPMMAIELNQRLAPFNGRAVMGLLGNDFISSRIVEIDYAAQRLRIHDPKRWTYDGDGAVIPTRTRGHTFINGVATLPGGRDLKARFLLDTGAGLTMTFNTPFVNKHHLLDVCDPPFQTTVGFGLGGEVRHSVCRIEGLRLGRAVIDSPIATLSQDRGGALAAGEWDGLIGGEILSGFRVILDGPGRRMILEEREDAPASIEFDMSGLTLAARDGRLVAFRVLEGSPAAAAGLKEGDAILAVDGRAVGALDRDRVKRLLRRDGAQRTLRIERDGEERTVRLRLRRLVLTDPSIPPPTLA